MSGAGRSSARPFRRATRPLLLLLAPALLAGCGGEAGKAKPDAETAGAVRLERLYTVDSLREPESVAWDAARRRWLVSNKGGWEASGVGRGFVTAVSGGGGSLTRRAYGAGTPGLRLDGPTGIAADGDRAAVVDRGRVHVIDLAGDSLLFSVPVPESEFLNDVAFAEDGSLIVSDTGLDGIFRIAADGSSHERWPASGSLRGPNGILYQGPDRPLLLAAWEGAITALNPDSSVSLLAESLEFERLDGIQRAPDGRLLVTDFAAGVLRAVGRNRERIRRESEVWLSDLAGPADLLVRDSILALPELGGDRVTFYRIAGTGGGGR